MLRAVRKWPNVDKFPFYALVREGRPVLLKVERKLDGSYVFYTWHTKIRPNPNFATDILVPLRYHLPLTEPIPKEQFGAVYQSKGVGLLFFIGPDAQGNKPTLWADWDMRDELGFPNFAAREGMAEKLLLSSEPVDLENFCVINTVNVR